MTLRIRPAGIEDAEALLALVRALAEYERAPHAVTATIEDYRERGFGPRPLFEALLAEEDGEALGFALYFFTFSTWTGKPSLYLEDLFVRPRERGRGLGKALFVEVARLGVQRGCARYDFQVLDWNQPSIDFYLALGARAQREWLPFRVEGEALCALAAKVHALDPAGATPARGEAQR